ncbi:alpha/beta fold hydrolase [Streptomyces atratus]|uniref:alpha/beta fold hydrolase n=1 Tax=Streptomyces atratus TaxID=1893 RepID=UPI0033F442FC
MAEHRPERSPNTDEQVVDLGDAAMYVVQDGAPGAPVLLLIHGLGASTAWWDPVVPRLAGAYRVICVDLLGHGRSTSPAGGYEIPAQARRIGAALDMLAVPRAAVVVGHSTGGSVATALAEQRPEAVSALALIGTGPSPDADISNSLLSRLLLDPVHGRLLWRLFTETIIRKSLSSAFTRPVVIPDAIVDGSRGMPHRALAATARASLDYIEQRALPERLIELHMPVLVIFGADDRRWRSSSADAYRVVPGVRVEVLPGVGHTPMYEDPQTTCALLMDFAAPITRAY